MTDDPDPREALPQATSAQTPPTERPAAAPEAAQTSDAGTPVPEAPEAPAAETPGAEIPEAEAAETAAAETPGAETLTAEAPAAETPAAETPAAETPAAETPAAETPAAETPGAETPEAETPGAEAAEGAPTTTAKPLREPDEDALRLAEALVFASAEPVTPRGLARVLPDDIDADAVLAALRARYAGRGVELVDAANGVMFRSALDLAPRLRKVIDQPRRLPRVAMETLAIVAYHQPMTRPEIEHIRGTALSQQTLDSLLELNLIAPKGRRETPGRPTLWGTTPEFLAHFGLKDLRELPRREDLLLETAPPRATPEAIPADLQPRMERAPERPAEPAPEPASERAPEPASERAPEPTSEHAPEPG
jgi:segregation and condensation protein B